MSKFWEHKVSEEIDRRNKSDWRRKDPEENEILVAKEAETLRQREEDGLGDDAHIKAAPYRYYYDRVDISSDGAVDRSSDKVYRHDEFDNIQLKLQDLSEMFKKSQEVLLKINRDLIEMQRIQQVKDVRKGGRVSRRRKMSKTRD
jgi:hypothetical protein